MVFDPLRKDVERISKALGNPYRQPKCRKHPDLEKLISKYRKGVPLVEGVCPVCQNIEALDIIAEEARKAGRARRF